MSAPFPPARPVVFDRSVGVEVDSSAAETCKNSRGMGYRYEDQPRFRPSSRLETHPSENLILICFRLLLDHKKRMIKQEHLEVFFVSRSASPIQRTLVHELSVLSAQFEIYIFPRAELKLSLKLMEMESIFRFA
jgi:hypothetical protein